ncbi:hypothetical protein BD413DRAFT_613149 [Trametes elegans]|nr:hypothetical protein BD413DRAFT_613149 [Trametes elegans]
MSAPPSAALNTALSSSSMSSRNVDIDEHIDDQPRPDGGTVPNLEFRQDASPVRTPLVHSAVPVLSLALVPYMLVRRQLLGLDKRGADLRAANSALRRDGVRRGVWELGERVEGGFAETREYVDEAVNGEARRLRHAFVHAQRAAFKLETARAMKDREIQNCRDVLLNKNDIERWVFL